MSGSVDPNEPVISFRDVMKRYGSRIALDRVTFDIRPGTRVALLGPNGAGKTTAVRLMTGRTRPSRGGVRVLGAEPGSRALHGRVGVVPQDPGMYTDLTAGEYLDLARSAYGRTSAADVVATLGLSEHLGTLMADLSGGYQRRFVLAAALLADPALLVLDEPTVGLDALAAHDVRRQLRERLDGRTVLLCTHNLAEADALCDLVIMLRAGAVIVYERIDTLRARAGARLRLTTRQAPSDVVGRFASAGLRSFRIDGSTVIADVSRDAIPALLRQAINAGVDVFEARIEERSLEQIFVQVMES